MLNDTKTDIQLFDHFNFWKIFKRESVTVTQHTLIIFKLKVLMILKQMKDSENFGCVPKALTLSLIMNRRNFRQRKTHYIKFAKSG